MALIDIGAQITVIPGGHTKFKQNILYTLTEATKHKIEDKQVCLPTLIIRTTTLAKFPMVILPIALNIPELAWMF